jgi:hypothetical protein
MSNAKQTFVPTNFHFDPALPQYCELNGAHDKFNYSDSNQLLVYLKVLVSTPESLVTELVVAKKLWGDQFDELIQSAIQGDVTNKITEMVLADHKTLSESKAHTWCNVSRHCKEIFDLVAKLRIKEGASSVRSQNCDHSRSQKPAVCYHCGIEADKHDDLSDHFPTHYCNSCNLAHTLDAKCLRKTAE